MKVNYIMILVLYIPILCTVYTYLSSSSTLLNFIDGVPDSSLHLDTSVKYTEHVLALENDQIMVVLTNFSTCNSSSSVLKAT